MFFVGQVFNLSNQFAFLLRRTGFQPVQSICFAASCRTGFQPVQLVSVSERLTYVHFGVRLGETDLLLLNANLVNLLVGLHQLVANLQHEPECHVGFLHGGEDLGRLDIASGRQ